MLNQSSTLGVRYKTAQAVEGFASCLSYMGSTGCPCIWSLSGQTRDSNQIPVYYSTYLPKFITVYDLHLNKSVCLPPLWYRIASYFCWTHKKHITVIALLYIVIGLTYVINDWFLNLASYLPFPWQHLFSLKCSSWEGGSKIGINFSPEVLLRFTVHM